MNLRSNAYQEKQDTAMEDLYQTDARTAYNICKACEGCDTCTYPINLSRPLLHCAEFKPFPSRVAVTTVPVDSAANIVSSNDEICEYPGLCKNCEIKEDCTYYKPGIHVLNCEEYQ
ncbi:hypothetical protein ACFL6O_03770 [candidate division KSB1 bacterium]